MDSFEVFNGLHESSQKIIANEIVQSTERERSAAVSLW